MGADARSIRRYLGANTMKKKTATKPSPMPKKGGKVMPKGKGC